MQNQRNLCGITANTFKARLATHKQSFNNRNSNQTTLSKHIWDMKDKKINYNITYKIIGRGQPYNPKTGKCLLCLKEKTIIITKPSSSTLNKKNEFVNKCPHRDKHLLAAVT